MPFGVSEPEIGFKVSVIFAVVATMQPLVDFLVMLMLLVNSHAAIPAGH